MAVSTGSSTAPEVSLRDRAWRAACRIHRKTGSPRCPVGKDISEAVLAEVRTWLLEQAAAYAHYDEVTAIAITDLAHQVTAP
jgi:hypothetical protein